MIKVDKMSLQDNRPRGSGGTQSRGRGINKVERRRVKQHKGMQCELCGERAEGRGGGTAGRRWRLVVERGAVKLQVKI